jgi:23S rRNA (cytosine1962-C5)-methyltransferase
MNIVVLKKNKDKPIRAGHPWVFSGAIARCSAGAAPGSACIVKSASGDILGHGYYNPYSSIAVRMLTKGDTAFGAEELLRRMAAAVKRREAICDDSTDCCRLINSEGDFIPGLIVDKYGAGLAMQIATAGMQRFRDDIVSALTSLCAPSFLYERGDSEIKKREKLTGNSGLVFGTVPSQHTIRENDLLFPVDIESGQKTGGFLDQRENRRLFRLYAPGAVVADCFAYTGGFSLNALAGGARKAYAIDSSASALTIARRARELNGFKASPSDFIEADVFDYLRAADNTFSLIVLDPPKFAKHSRDIDSACRGYKDINLLGIRRAAPGAILFTFSCSQAIDTKLFRQIVFAAASDSRRSVQVLHVLSQPPDHPVSIAHKEGEYLKGLVLRIV